MKQLTKDSIVNYRLPKTTPSASAKLFLALMRHIEWGELTVHTPDGNTHRFGAAGTGCVADIYLRDWRVCGMILRGGDNAFAETYLAGRWESSDLTALLILAAHNQAVLEKSFYGNKWWQLWFRLRHLLRGNSRSGSKRNILAHYDLGNDFYRLWLDPSMTYSSAWFADRYEQSLQAAQDMKYERILQQLDVKPNHRVLEIGCGWGAFAEYAARSHGCRVTGISLSPAQLEYARVRIARAGLEERVELKLCDYRDIKGEFDAIVSIEMFEAVGERYWPVFFTTLNRALPRGGRAVIQTITIADQRFERYRTTSDFIQQYIFPGGMLISPNRLKAESEKGGLNILDSFTFGLDYAETLKRWLKSFADQESAIRELGFDTRFIRLWRFYLAYCIAAFTSRTTDVAQFVLVSR